MRIAVVFKDRCQPKKCHLECMRYCPPMRTGTEVIWLGEDGKAEISEETCISCGICIRKCPFDAIRIIGVPDALKEDLIHQYGKNGFRIFRLSVPRSGHVVGLLGPNGIGKTTVVKILSGELVPNLGNIRRKKGRWEDVLAYFKGTEVHDYLRRVADEEVRTSIKPQYVDKLPAVAKGTVKELLKKVDQRGRFDAIADALDLRAFLDHDIGRLSGGELQRTAVGAAMLKDAEVYFFDEPSSYLDIHQRLKVARAIQELSQERQVVVVEHDLAILDFLADVIHVMYGEEGAYGIIAQPRAVRTAVNAYLGGYLKEENMRIRTWPITFEAHPPKEEWKAAPLLRFGALEKRYGSFTLTTEAGDLRKGEVIGVVGANATGKTTFVKMLAGVEPPSKGRVEGKWRVAYKPQYLEGVYRGTVRELFTELLGPAFESSYYLGEVLQPLGVPPMMERDVVALSGGELQRVAVALCLGREADIYLIDEPSAYLDSNQRMIAAKVIRRVMEQRGRSGLIVDHDVYFLDMVSDRLMVFSGEPARRGFGAAPHEMREGMNTFLAQVDVTFRRDADTNRPRINKPDSRLDREQREKGEYYYAIAEEETAA